MGNFIYHREVCPVVRGIGDDLVSVLPGLYITGSNFVLIQHPDLEVCLCVLSY